MTERLLTEPRPDDPDGTYGALGELHAGLSEEESRAATVRLIMLLANHTGDAEVLREAIRADRPRP